MPVKVINSHKEFKEIIDSDKPVVIDFWAPWCGPCKAISPVFEKISDSVGNVGFYKVDIDTLPDVAEEVGIRVVPTFMLFKDGQKLQEVTGANPKSLEGLIFKAAALD